jgi:tetratricopeptide (TPR) repeat protein
MKHPVLVISLFLLLSCSSGVKDSVKPCISNNLVKYETLVYDNPGAALDSLKSIDFTVFQEELGGDDLIYNKGGLKYHLTILQSIGYEQKYGKLKSNPQIGEAVKWYRNSSDSYNLCRSLLYRSIELYSKSKMDTNAYQLLKEAETLFSKHNFNNRRLEATLYLYLGRTTRRITDPDIAEEYIKRSLDVSRSSSNINGILNASLELFTFYTGKKRYSEALANIACFGDQENLPPYLMHNLYNALYSYYITKKDFNVAIVYLKKILEIDNTDDLDINYSKVYYQLSSTYKRLGIDDSIKHFAKLSVASLRDTNDLESHFYYRNLGDLYAKEDDYKSSSSLYKRAYNSYMIAFARQAQHKIREIESKYGLDEKNAELSSLKRERGVLINIIFILIAIVIISFIYHLFQIKNSSKDLAELERLVMKLSNENREMWLTSKISKASSFILPQLIEGVYMEALRSRKLSNEIFDSLNTIIDQANSLSRNALGTIVTDEKFNELYSHLTNLDLLTDFEKLIYILSEDGFSNSEIANLLNSSPPSIRTMRGKINRKIHKKTYENGDSE